MYAKRPRIVATNAAAAALKNNRNKNVAEVVESNGDANVPFSLYIYTKAR